MDRATTAAFLLIALTLAGCDSYQQTPTAPNPPQASAAPANPPSPTPTPTDDRLVGSYKLPLNVGSGCGAILDAARVRQYTATINATGDAAYVVTVSDATFLTGLIYTATVTRLGCDQFLASRKDDMIEFNLVNNNDDGHGGHIVEQLPSGTWIEIIGTATANCPRRRSRQQAVALCGIARRPQDIHFPASVSQGAAPANAADVHAKMRRTYNSEM